MSRPACVVVDLAAARRNLERARALAPRARLMAVVKADGYGHGLVRVARAFAAADAFGVACLDEALELRGAGVAKPVVALQGAYTGAELERMRGARIDTVVHHEAQVRMLERAPAGARIGVWIKVDTGMHRLGFEPHAVADVARRLAACTAVAPGLTYMTQLACAFDRHGDSVARQLAVFERAVAGLPGARSIANSAALVAWPQAHGGWVRPGLMLYGASPLEGVSAAALGLEPVMSLRSTLIAVRNIAAGEAVGYGAAWRAPEPMPIGVVALGYGDGYPRHAASGTPARVAGTPVQVIGYPSMDMLCVDLRACPQAEVGDPVLLWGEDLPVEEVARHAGTVAYELLCSVRVRARYVERDDDAG